MIKFRIDKETPDYITMDRDGLICLCLNFSKLPNDAFREESDMIRYLASFEKWGKERLTQIGIQCISEFKIRKESALGKYLIENNGRNEIVDYTNYITFQDIQNAYLISSFNNDDKMTNKILTLFQKECFGFKEELLEKFPYCAEAIEFILKNNDFDSYLARRNHEEEPIQEVKSFVVYEDGEWAIKNFSEEYVRVPKKA